ncbi:MAG TPA: radical SAM protein [Anaerovoracaceae bacterium]|nr:radical SAM protein [Anaerovoracaceae bacterium]
MKTHAIIPIFIPHLGCPNDCAFCNQKKITARTNPLSGADMAETAEKYLKTINGRGIETVEIAFFGGSFTGIPLEQQREYLSVAKSYKDRGAIQKIRLSTRPDYISDEILANLRQYGADIIELGVQSFDDETLRLSNRGHSREAVYTASRLIRDYGFELGLQLMIGLPGDTREKSVESAREAAKIRPSVARLYPTVIIKDTALYDMYLRGEYTPLTREEALGTTKDMYRILTDAGVNVIRIGLKSTDLIRENGEIAGGYHPAFRQLVESEIAREQMEAQLLDLLKPNSGRNNTGEGDFIGIAFCSNAASFSNMIGHRKSNRVYFEEKYPHVRFTFHVDPNLTDHIYSLKIPDRS